MNEFIGKPQLLKEINSSMIEQLISKKGPLSKPKLSDITHLSLPTVNKIVDDLEKNGRICPVGLSESGLGRKAMLYEINKDFGCIIALYYLWGKYICRVADMVGNTLHEEILDIDSGTAKTAADSTMLIIDKMINVAPSKVRAIGVGVPGAVMPDGRLCGIPKIEVWEGFNLEELLARKYDADIYVENDVKLSTVGYYLTYLSDRFDNIVYIYVGNGIGSGTIINKKLYRGSTNFSGELGFMAPLSGSRPQQDYTAVGGYLEAQLRPFIHCGKTSPVIKLEGKNRETVANILAETASNYVAVINPDAIVFGGEAFDDALIGEVRAIMSFYSPVRSMPQMLHDNGDRTGIDGLVLICINSISTQVQLVQNGGV